MYICLSLFSFHLYLASYLDILHFLFCFASREMGLNLKFASLRGKKI